MPAHDWTRVTAGIFHDFQIAWIADLLRALNIGLLPSDYYALAEQRVAKVEVCLPVQEGRDEQSSELVSATLEHGGGTVLALKRPKAPIVGEVDDASLYALKRRTITIRYATNDRIVALLEIASSGNKDRAQSVQKFVDKAVAVLQSGYHLVVVDLFPPGPSDPAGLGSAVWEEINGKRLGWPAGKLLSATSFHVAARFQCYGEPFAVGEAVPEIPLFYDPDWYVNLPLEATYAAAYEGVPRRWKQVIESASDK